MELKGFVFLFVNYLKLKLFGWFFRLLVNVVNNIVLLLIESVLFIFSQVSFFCDVFLLIVENSFVI